MQLITKKEYFYYIAFMIMASTFLSLLFYNLPPIIRSHHIWTAIWVLSLLVFYPKIFINKMVLYLLAYGLFIFIATRTFWSSMDYWNRKILFTEFYQFAIGVSVITYFFQTGDYIGLAKITRWTIVFLFITAIMTIISSAIDPMYARNLTALSAVTSESEREFITGFKRYGGGTYSTAAAFMALAPIFIYYYKNIKRSLFSKKQIIIFLIIIFLALLGMQIFTNIIVAVVFCIIALLGMKKIKYSILVIGLFFSILLIIPKEIYIKNLLSVSNHLEKYSELSYKFRDLAAFIETGVDFADNSTGTGLRAERYPALMETFVKKPLLGCYFLSAETGNGYLEGGVHLYWMNKLTVTGIISLLFFLIIPFNFIRNTLKHFNSNYKLFYILASLSILSYGLIKAVAGRDTWYVFFILLPGLYYLPLLKKQ